MTAGILDAAPANLVTVEVGNMVLTFCVAPNSVLVTMQADAGQRIILQSVRMGSELQTRMDLTWQPRDERHTTLEALYFACGSTYDHLVEELGATDPRAEVVSAVQELVQINLATT